MRWRTAVGVAALMLVACSSDSGASSAGGPSEDAVTEQPSVVAAAPDVPDGPLDAEASDALDRLLAAIAAGDVPVDLLDEVAGTHDARIGWLLADILRFPMSFNEHKAVIAAFEELTGFDPVGELLGERHPWRLVTDQMIAWDLPALPDYRERKATLFLAFEPAWEPFFDDVDAAVDWRLVSWGGVYIDDRATGDESLCTRGCIPALDSPPLTDAEGGSWYPHYATVFAVEVNGEAVAFPKNIMEVHEMVNITIGGRRLGIPYCTLCGSAQAYFTDSVPDSVEPPLLRTTGLLSRSNKVMYDFHTKSLFDTFTGRAVSGPLQDVGVELEQATVVTSTWEDWKAEHPDTRIVARDGGIGAEYPSDPLQGRDDNGPIFPVGPVDPRQPVQAQVVGVIAPDGTPVAFPADQARAALDGGRRVELAGVELVEDGGGLRARRRDGAPLVSHQAFWFAWSQFNPDTEVWAPLDG